MLSSKTISIVKSTVPVLETHGLKITNRFYKNLFNEHPELFNVFNQTNQKGGRQPAALANAVYAAAKYIDNLETIVPAVMVIAHKHRSLGIVPEQYPIVGKNLLRAIKEELGDAATDDILEAWGQAYGVIADVFIQVEEDLYKKAEENGGWRFFKNFKVVKKEKESNQVTSFYLEAEDGSKVPPYISGQYIGLRMKIPEHQYLMNRQYTVSQPFSEGYRISVKREDNSTPNGIVSVYLHDKVNVGDIIEVSAPAGEFVLDKSTDPIVFVSGGIGVTPLYSMLHSIQGDRKVTFLQAARNKDVIAFNESISKKVKELRGIHKVLYSDNGEHLDQKFLSENIPNNAHFYVCGPGPFMESVIHSLKNLNIPSEKIHYEFFGPAMNV